MNIDALKKMTREQLLELAGKQGLQVHPRAKDETIIKHLVDSVFNAQPPVINEDDMVDPRLKPVRQAVFNTKEQVEAMLAPIKARVPEFQSIYNDEDRTVTFSCKGAVDCHNLSVPLRWLKQKAEIVARGRLVLVGLNNHGFDTLNGNPNSSYTNTVLAG